MKKQIKTHGKKFRAWSERDEKMYENVAVGEDVIYQKLGEGKGRILKDCIPLQLCGHTDSGDEYYEGDVVEGISNWDGKKYTKVHWLADLNDEWVRMNAVRLVKVIGNVYQDPSLHKNLKN